jgi:hypothetical protein
MWLGRYKWAAHISRDVSNPPRDSDRPETVVDEKADPADNTPTVTCSQCDRTWALDYELDSLYAGNQAFEQFALDHKRHTGHFPDDVTPWIADCDRCPAAEQYLDEGPARRWAETHARHTTHPVSLTHEPSDVATTVAAEATDQVATAEQESE